MRSDLADIEHRPGFEGFLLSLLPGGLRSRLLGSGAFARFLRLASWSMMAFLLEKGAQTLVIVMLAKILGATEYGRLSLAQGMVNTAQLFVVLGAGTVLARYIPAMLEESFQRAVEIVNLCAGVILGTMTIFVLIAVVASPAIAVSLLGLPAHSTTPYWIIAWVLVTAANGLLLTILLAFEEGRALGAVSLAAALVTVVTVPIVSIQWGFQGAIIGLTATGAFKAMLLLRFYARLLASRGVKLLVPARRSDAPLLLSFGLPVFLSSALWAPTMWAAQIILKQYSPNGLASVGVFGFSNNILGLVVLISSITNRAAFPILSSLKARGDFREVRKFVFSISLVQIAAATAIGAPIAIFSPQIMAAMGPEFAVGGPALLAMVFAGIFLSGQQPLINLLLVNDRAGTNLLAMGLWSASLLSLSFLFVDRGAVGVAYGVLAAAIIKGAFVGFTVMPLGKRDGGRA